MSSEENKDEEIGTAMHHQKTSSTMVVTVDENPVVDRAKPRYEIVSTSSPFGFFHPTHATVRDTETGEIYEWSSRKHRKLRHLSKSKQWPFRRHLPRILTCEPHIVTWWLNITNEIANIFWIVSGVFATWPSLCVSADTSSRTVYAAGIIAGVFMIASCYLSYVEAINHSHADIVLPNHDDKRNNKRVQVHTRRFVRPQQIYGRHRSPLGEQYHGIDDKKRQQLIRMGFPIVETATLPKRLVTMDVFDEAIVSSPLTNDETLRALQVKVNLCSSKYVCTTQVIHVAPVDEGDDGGFKRSYMWWTWSPSLNHLGVLCALIGFISAIVYLIPMCMGYPLAKNGNATQGVTLFFVDLLQIIPYICFAAIGHLYIAEAAGSWWKLKFDSIGWWIAVFNTVGAYGFLFCGALAIPDTVGSNCCPNMAKWGSAFACFWGSSSYLVGGILMMIEFANPEPIVICGGGKAQKNDKKDQEKHT